MRLDYFEQAYTLDPESLMLMAEEGEDDHSEVDIRESQCRSGLHRTAPRSSDTLERFTTEH